MKEQLPVAQESSELIRRLAFGVGGALALGQNLLWLGAFAPLWYINKVSPGWAAFGALLMIAGFAGLGAPYCRQIAKAKHAAINVVALTIALATSWPSLLWITDAPALPNAGPAFFELLVWPSLAGSLSAIATALWPRKGWSPFLTGLRERLRPHLCAMLGGSTGPRYRD